MTPNTLLLRQVHPTFLQNGRPTSQVFRPTPKDNEKLSVYDGDKIQPQASWIHYTTVLRFESAGVLAVSFAECSLQELSVLEDAALFPEHCSIDFTGLSKKDVDKKAKLLAADAVRRNWLFQRPQKEL